MFKKATTAAAHEAAKLPPLDIDAILAWFRGAALKRVTEEVVPLILASEEIGGWETGASRKVRAIFSKSAEAQKLVRKGQEDWRRTYKSQAEDWLWEVGFMMQFGPNRSLSRISETIPDLSKIDAPNASVLVDGWRRWRAAFEPLIERMVIWDMRPVYRAVPGHASATVAKTLATAELPESLDTLRIPDIEYVWEEIEVAIKGTQKVETQSVRVGYIVWPDKTVHNRSRFSGTRTASRGIHQQCHACGHAIKNSLNWVPLVVDSAAGVPHSMWVGSDCALNLFGVKVTNPAMLKNRPASK